MGRYALSKRSLAIVACAFLVGGCAGGRGMDALKVELDEIKARPSGEIAPPPKFKTYENFIYSAAVMRSPFQPPIIEEDTGPKLPKVNGNKVAPDLARRKEVLEDHSLESLNMVGTIQREGEGLYALVKDQKLVVHRVLPGNYMGRNHGKIESITNSKIDLTELISDGQGGWVERRRTISLKDE